MDSTEEKFNLDSLKKKFEKCQDVIFHPFEIGGQKITFLTCEEMIDQQMIYSFIIPTIEKHISSSNGIIHENELITLPFPELKKLNGVDEVISEVFLGMLIIYFHELQLLLSCNIAKKPNRTPEETRMEVLVKGPRDNFIEDIATNIALIRKRIPTNSLCVEKFEIGARSKTTVAILYFDDIANKKILEEIKQQLDSINSDIILSGDSLIEHFKHKSRIMPWTNETGRPDFAIQSLVRGRFVLLVDGTSYAIVTPINFSFLLKAGEDFEYPILFSSFERILRLTGVYFGITLPAFWLSLTTFHQNQLPLQLLATVVVSNRGLPLPAALEMIILLIMFEMFREAGLRLPTAIGSTISVVGGLIIGDAAIRAGITSPSMLVIISLSFVATFTIANQALLSIVTIIRIFFIIVTSFFGLFGFFLCLFLLLLYMANLRIFGVPYINISADLSWATVGKSLFRLPKKYYKKRPNVLNPKDKTRTSNEGHK